MSLNYASLLHTCFHHRFFSPTVARLDRRLDDDLITSARRADVSLLARPTHACTCYCKFPGNQGRRQPVWSWAAATVSLDCVIYCAFYSILFRGAVFTRTRCSFILPCIISACMLYYCSTVRCAWLDWGLSGWLTTLLQCFVTVGWVIRSVKHRLQNDLNCVEWDVQPCSKPTAVYLQSVAAHSLLVVISFICKPSTVVSTICWSP